MRGPVAAVELMRDIAVIRRIFRQIRIEQIKRNVTDFRLPNLDGNLALRQFHFDSHFRTIVTQHGRYGQILKIRISIGTC